MQTHICTNCGLSRPSAVVGPCSCGGETFYLHDEPETVKLISQEEYDRMAGYIKNLEAAVERLEDTICGLVLEQNTERVTINRRSRSRAPGFTPRIQDFVESVEVTVINNLLLKIDTPDSSVGSTTSADVEPC